MEEKFEYFMEKTDEQLKEIRKDVRSLLEFKWKALGVLIAINAVMIFLIEVLLKT